MIKKIIIVLMLLGVNLLLANPRSDALKADLRYIPNGASIYNNGYVDQPYLLILPNKDWFCVFTTSAGHEGSKGQHIVFTASKDEGKTWSKPEAIESPTEPASSWATPYLTSFGRIYVFYDFNGEDITSLDGKKIRNDMLGWYCYRFTDDFGKTWSKRYRLPLRLTNCDKANNWQGKVQIFWGIDKPKKSGGTFYMGFTKLGKYMLENGEGWLFKCDNIETQKDPEKLNWQMLPEGENGIRNADFGSIQEEHNLVPMQGENLFCVYRTRTGYLGSSYSKDGGKTWGEPEFLEYALGGKIKNSRACPKLYKTSEGKYLLWYHNHSLLDFGGYANRNPAWISGGVEKDGKILWSEPEIFLYEPEDLSFETGRYSYPDFWENGKDFWVSETQKVKARIHKIDRTLLEGLWQQLEGGLAKPEDSVIYTHGKDSVFETPNLQNASWSLELVLDTQAIKGGEIILDTRNNASDGIWIYYSSAETLRFCIYSNRQYFEFSLQPKSLSKGKNHVVITLDGLPRIATGVVNGHFMDGGDFSGIGWFRFGTKLSAVKTSENFYVSKNISLLRLHKRALRTSEAIFYFNKTKKDI